MTLEVRTDGDTVWLNRNQISELFGHDIKTIGKHINNALKEELLDDDSTVAKFATVQIEGERKVTRDIEYYNLDVKNTKETKYILSRAWTGYRKINKQKRQYTFLSCTAVCCIISCFYTFRA